MPTAARPVSVPSVPGLTDLLREKRLAGFRQWLESNGAEILAPTNEWEILRFRARGGVHVVYRNKTGSTVTCSSIRVHEAWQAYRTSQSWRAGPSQKRKMGNRRYEANVDALLKRDGDECFYCGGELGNNITIEHLVGRSQQGPNHLANLALAHEACNKEAGSLSVVEKVKLREQKRAAVARWRKAQSERDSAGLCAHPQTEIEGVPC